MCFQVNVYVCKQVNGFVLHEIWFHNWSFTNFLVDVLILEHLKTYNKMSICDWLIYRPIIIPQLLQMLTCYSLQLLLYAAFSSDTHLPTLTPDHQSTYNFWSGQQILYNFIGILVLSIFKFGLHFNSYFQLFRYSQCMTHTAIRLFHHCLDKQIFKEKKKKNQLIKAKNLKKINQLIKTQMVKNKKNFPLKKKEFRKN